MYSDREALANSVDSDQTPHSLGMAGSKRDLLTFPLGVIGRLCSMIMLFLNILYTCSDIRTIMVRSSGARILMINTLLHVSRFATRKMDLRVPKSYNHGITCTSICNRKDEFESVFWKATITVSHILRFATGKMDLRVPFEKLQSMNIVSPRFQK